MLLIATGFVLGALLFQQLPLLPAVGWLLPVLLIAWAGWRFFRATLILGLAAGFSWAHLHALITQPDEIPDAWLKDGVVATGSIEGIPDHNAHRTRFFFRVEQLRQGEQRLTGDWRLRLSWYRSAPRLQAGEPWRLPLRLKPVDGYRNPGGFDYAGWLYARGVVYTGHVKGEGAPAGSATASLDAYRQIISEQIDGSSLSPRAVAVLKALVVGERSSLSAKDREVFAATGTSHLMAISGLHIGLVAGLVYFVMQWSWRRFPPLCNRWPAQVAAAPFAMGSAIVYAALAGFSIPTQRALIMLSVVLLAVMLRRTAASFHVLGIALMAVILWDPLAVISAGFWLSFGAVASIMFITRHGARGFDWLWLQLGVFLALMPVLAWYEMPVSLVAPLVNLLAIPAFSLLIVPLSLASVLVTTVAPDFSGLLMLAGWVLDGFLLVLEWIADRSPVLYWPRFSGYFLLAVAAGALLLLYRAMKRGLHPLWQLSALSLGALSLLICIRQTPPPAANHFCFTLLDVGQGLSAVIQTRKHVLVFDTGPRFPSGFNTGSAVLLPYLKRQGIAEIDRLILSHSDMDHVGGTPDLIQKMPVAEVLSGEPPGLGMRLPARRCRAGELWWWDGVRFEILYPPADTKLEGNDASCVLRVSVDGQAVLLTGDIEAQGENWLLQHRPDRLRSQVVVAAHHGSSSSSTAAFVQAVEARHVLFSAGRGNRWGFPTKEVEKRWQSSGAQLLNTAESGAISFEAGEGMPILPSSWAPRTRRYWHW